MCRLQQLVGYFFLSLSLVATQSIGADASKVGSKIEAKFATIKKDAQALYAFFKEMPKGGELHYHLAGGASPENMLALAAKGDFCFNKTSFALSKEPCSGIASKDLFSDPIAYNQALRAWSMKDFIAGIESGHDHFFATFFKFIPMVEPNLIALLAEIMLRAINQHALYMEIMLLTPEVPVHSSSLAVKPENYLGLKKEFLSNQSFIEALQKQAKQVEALLPETRHFLGCDKDADKAVCQLLVKFQCYVLREQPADSFFPQALMAFEMALRADSIVGVNLVQAEDGLISLRDYRQQMQIFAFLHQQYPAVNIALHAGELSSDLVKSEDLTFHIQDAIKIGQAQRIGHGVSIAYEDNAEKLLDYMAKKAIAVEINLVSNAKILNISGKKHPLSYYLAHKVPIVLSTDDEGILRTDLTEQYVNAVLEQGLGWQDIKQINRNALTFSFLKGPSIWQAYAKAIPVKACLDMHAQSCINFVKSKEKAKLQRTLELALEDFESAA